MVTPQDLLTGDAWQVNLGRLRDISRANLVFVVVANCAYLIYTFGDEICPDLNIVNIGIILNRRQDLYIS